MTLRRWTAVAALAVAVALLPAPATASPLPIGSCTPTSGVILAVDFSHWGGPLLRACGSTPTTGYQLLNQGGWSTAGTQHDGPGFICRIGYSGYHGGTKYPTADDEKCVLTPPTNAYWSYWHANPGATSWTYSQLGAVSYKPKPGSVDLWIFGATSVDGTQGRPKFSPDSVRAHAPASPSPAKPKPKPSAATSSSRPNPNAADPPSPAAVPSASPTTVPSSDSFTAMTQAPLVVDAEPTTVASTADRGLPLPALATAGLLGLLAVAGGVLVWRRRIAAHGDE